MYSNNSLGPWRVCFYYLFLPLVILSGMSGNILLNSTHVYKKNHRGYR